MFSGIRIAHEKERMAIHISVNVCERRGRQENTLIAVPKDKGKGGTCQTRKDENVMIAVQKFIVKAQEPVMVTGAI